MNSSNQDGPYFLPLRGAPEKPHAPAASKSARFRGDADQLSLVRASRNPDGDWPADDYDVFDGKRQVGRITLTTAGPSGMPWFWEITARPDSAQNRGYAVSCDQAMREFRARWANPARF